MKRLLGPSTLAFVLLACATAAEPAAKVRIEPSPGTRAYRYTVIEVVNGAPQGGYRTDFDIKIGPGKSATAQVMASASTDDGKVWTQASPDPACLAAMHAPAGGLATVVLWPLSDSVARGLGAGFVDLCAPDAVFYPLTDILNVMLVQFAPNFKAATLKNVGDHASYDGFEAAFTRNGQTFKETAHGGEVRFVSLENGRVTLDWAPEPAELEILRKGPQGQPLTLRGTEHFAFRLVIEARTGALIRADTTYDDLDLTMTMPGLPAPMPLKISRQVHIEPRPGADAPRRPRH